MKNAIYSLLCTISVLVCPMPMMAQESTEQPKKTAGTAAEQAFKRFRSLVGKFRTIETPERSAEVEYELWSKDTALIEKWRMASGKREFTVFTLDGDRMIATHYCAIGVQSKMQLELPVKEETYEFKLIEAANLPTPDSPHNSAFSYQFPIDGSINRREYWSKAGKQTDSLTTMIRSPTNDKVK